MNWYIYWYFTIRYFFWGLLGYGRAGNNIGFLFFHLPFIALIMALIAPIHFVHEAKLVNTYDALLEQIQLPISFDEAMVLVQIFPENAFYDLQWSLLKLVESVCVDDENKYIQLINSCPSQEWRDTLNARYVNYKKAQEAK